MFAWTVVSLIVGAYAGALLCWRCCEYAYGQHDEIVDMYPVPVPVRPTARSAGSPWVKASQIDLSLRLGHLVKRK